MKCQVLIDWLTFSVKETDPSKVIQTYLGMDPALFQDTGYSLMGYSKVMRFSDILVCSEGRDDSNITRCTVCSWWRDFVGELESVRLVAREVIQHTVEQIGNWVEAQVGPSLAILFQTMGWPYIFELAKDSAKRLSDKQVSLVTDYNSLQIARGVI